MTVLLETVECFRSIWDNRLEFLHPVPKAMIFTIPGQSSCTVVYPAHPHVFCSVFFEFMIKGFVVLSLDS